MYNKQMSTVANSCKDESIMEMEQFERGCKNKNNNNGCCNPQEPQFASPSQNNNQNHHQKHEHESYECECVCEVKKPQQSYCEPCQA